jgi:uncharacterized protein DUF5931
VPGGTSQPQGWGSVAAPAGLSKHALGFGGTGAGEHGRRAKDGDAGPGAGAGPGVGEMPRRERVMRMSVEQPLWRALTAYRVLTMLYAIGLFATTYHRFARPWVALAYYGVLFVWTLATLPST